MKVSVNWLKEFVDIDVSTDELVRRIGAQLGAVEDVIELGPKYEGARIVNVVSCVSHPDADKLKLCKIDDGGTVTGVDRDEQGHIQVVCGAPNVAAGLSVVWLPPGVTVPSTFHDAEPFKLEAREIRGQLSNGMLASAKELDLSDDHAGLMVLEESFTPGTTLHDALDLNDTIIDLENKMFTHRPDCFGILGVAREIAGILHKPFTSPSWYMEPLDILTTSTKLPLQIAVEDTDAVPRLTAFALDAIKLGPSPIKMQSMLTRVGIRPINNVVDITNWIMHLTAQPTHAFDYDKVRALDGGDTATLVARLAKKGESLRLLNGKTVEIPEGVIVIASATKPMAVAGVMGGAETEVDQQTTRVILECASFDMYSIRRATMQLGIFSEAATRFSKGQSPRQQPVVAGYATECFAELCGAAPASQLYDSNPDISTQQPTVTVSTGFINDRLDTSLSGKEIADYLRNVECVVQEAEALTVSPPFWRTDLELPEDIVEEVGRLHGLDKIPQNLPFKKITPAQADQQFRLKQQLRHHLSASGANEVLSYSFVHSDLLSAVGQDSEKAFRLRNALSPDAEVYRLSILPSLLAKVHPNHKAGHGEFALFEFGVSHQQNDLNDEKLPTERERLALVVSADPKAAGQYDGSAYFWAKYQLASVLSELNLSATFVPLADHQLTEEQTPLAAPFEPSRSACIYIDQHEGLLGVIGEFHARARASLKLPTYSAGFELELGLVPSFGDKTYVAKPTYPSVTQDLTLEGSAKITFDQISREFSAALEEVPEFSGVYCDVGPISIFRPENATALRTTFRVTVASYERTLTSVEVNEVLDKVAEKLTQKLEIKRA